LPNSVVRTQKIYSVDSEKKLLLSISYFRPAMGSQ